MITIMFYADISFFLSSDWNHQTLLDWVFISVALLGIFCGNKELGIYMGSGLPSIGHNYSEVHLTYEKELILRQKFFILDGNFFANLMA